MVILMLAPLQVSQVSLIPRTHKFAIWFYLPAEVNLVVFDIM